MVHLRSQREVRVATPVQQPTTATLTAQPLQPSPSSVGPVVEALAALVDGHIHEAPEAPTAVVVTGWRAAGKPPLALLVRDRLAEVGTLPDPPIVCEFNALDSEGDTVPGAALAAEVAKSVAGQRHWWRRAFQPVSTVMASPQTRWWRRIAAGALSALLAAVIVAIPSVQDVAAAFAEEEGAIGRLAELADGNPLITLALLSALFWFVAVRAWNATTALARFISSARDEAAQGTIGDVRGELARLILQALRRGWIRWRYRRHLIVAIRNIDCCRGDFAFELCEVAYKLLRHEHVVTIFLGEVEPLEEAAVRKFSMPGEAPQSVRGHNHIRDLIPIVVALPAPNPAELRDRMSQQEREVTS